MFNSRRALCDTCPSISSASVGNGRTGKLAWRQTAKMRLICCCVALGSLENKPFSVTKIAAYMHMPRNTVTRRLERLVQHWGVIERRGKSYYLRPEVANMPDALASYREVRRAIQRAVKELSILDTAEH